MAPRFLGRLFGAKAKDEAQEPPLNVQLVDNRAWSWPRRLLMGGALLYGGIYLGLGADNFLSGEDTPRGDVVPVIKLHGVIAAGQSGGGLMGPVASRLSIDGLRDQIDQAFNTANAVAVALDVNSPGGSPVQSELIADYIQWKAEETGLPVYSFVQDAAASGGYWLACAADEIYTARASMVGSIGVITSSIGYAELAETLGIESRTYTAGESKSRLDPLEPEKPEDVEWITARLEATHGVFKAAVTQCREGQFDENLDLDAKVFNGDDLAP